MRLDNKFSREFDTFLPSPLLQVRILAQNSLENFETSLNMNSYDDESFALRAPYADTTNDRFEGFYAKFM